MQTAFSLRELDPLLKEVIRNSPLDIGVISGELLLLVAILDRACRDTRDPRPGIRNSAIAWLQNHRTHRFNASEICEYLGIDYPLLKKGVRLSLETLPHSLAA